MLISNAKSLAAERRWDAAHDASSLQSHADWRRARHVFQHGEYFDSYLATEPGREEFWSSNGDGLISYTRRGRYVLVGGGLIAPDDHKPLLLKEFVQFLQDQKLRAAFHNIGDHELPVFREHGFQITKWGEEPVVDLGGITWGGKAYEWVRRQTNFCRRHGLQAFEVPHQELTPEQWGRTLEEMLEVSAESLASKPQRREMRFFEGRIGDHDVGLRRVFIVRSDEGLGRIEGFMVCTPMRAGTMWATELYRRRADAVRGTMAFLFHHVLQTLQEEGVQRVGLCLDPALRCGTRLPGDSAMVRLGMTWGEALLGCVFDVAGLRHFKSRFRPRYENRYVCVQPKVSIGSLLAWARVCGLFDVDPWKVAKISAQRIRKYASRSTLAEVH